MSQMSYGAGGHSSGSMAPHRGGLILALGILGMVICAPVGVAAFLMGRRDLAEMTAGRMDPSGRGTTQAGWILGIFSVIMICIGLLALMLGVVIAGIAAMNR